MEVQYAVNEVFLKSCSIIFNEKFDMKVVYIISISMI